MRHPWAALTLAAALVGPAAAGPAMGCDRVAGVGIGRCDDDVVKPRKTPSAGATERALFDSINRERLSHGLRPLTLDQTALKVARAHAAAMARRGDVYHNPKMRSRSGRRSLGLPGRAGENVGVGPDHRAIHAAFMDSRGHRGQILARTWRAGAVGVSVSKHQVWVVEVFIGGRGRAAAAPRAERPRATSGLLRPAAPLVAPADRVGEAGAGQAGPLLATGTPASGQPFPWEALLPSGVVGTAMLIRRRRRRAAWHH